jgi:hypothetical protein
MEFYILNAGNHYKMDMSRARFFWEGVGEKENIIWRNGCSLVNLINLDAYVLQCLDRTILEHPMKKTQLDVGSKLSYGISRYVEKH